MTANEEPGAGRKKRVFSGVQPTGKIHIGNYIGALSVWAEKQDEFDNIFCIVDLHALTIPEAINPEYLRAKIREVAALYLACGIDPKVSSIFIQSHVSEHAELTWILNCFTPVGWLEKMTQYKSKTAGMESVGAGLLDYPVLMAADILLYDTDLVPVGEDQKQHIELARNVAVRFNSRYGPIFTVPEPLIRASGARIMGLNDPGQKMSKSVAEHLPLHAVGLLDSPAAIEKAVMSAVTDSGKLVNFETSSAGVLNLMTIMEVLSGRSRRQIEQDYNGRGYGYLKQDLVHLLVETLRPIQQRYQQIVADESHLEGVLVSGAETVRAVAQARYAKVRQALGIG